MRKTWKPSDRKPEDLFCVAGEAILPQPVASSVKGSISESLAQTELSELKDSTDDTGFRFLGLPANDINAFKHAISSGLAVVFNFKMLMESPSVGVVGVAYDDFAQEIIIRDSFDKYSYLSIPYADYQSISFTEDAYVIKLVD